ncbi:MAG: amidohydrolase family protein [Kiritimatiellales bacterium]
MRIDSHTHIGFDPLYYLQGWSPYCADLTRLFLDAEGAEIDRFIVFPFITYMDLDMEKLRRDQVALSNDPDAVPYRFENKRLVTDIQRAPLEWREKIWPFLIGDPSRKPAEQVAEWRKLSSGCRVYGIKFQTHTIQSPVLDLLNQGGCMLDFAEEKNLPLLIHASIHPNDRWSQCADILRIVETRPAIRFVLAHSCRFHRPTLERMAELPNAWFDCAAFIVHCACAENNLPAVAAPEQRFPSDYSCPGTVLNDLAEAFPEKLIWGSDAPYYSIEYDRLQLRSSYRCERACLDAVSVALQERICCRNTLAWLGENGNNS